ncbi:hypothetical protein NEUTE1DRAFT_116581 [Neurospora tetrasperma FGSC 2508]|uniref:Uncharacterized protein n=1 Tax=Neurospora tetrasperma (strain FGSC 2508 / ATCC MYA-4615 / P0657) TaxID=510951 RepID=F8MHF7_NEUT8|nr:uncharacterized protein NEUTE1DRAFT_116581 [Neurospora tetrasperma FGSC 2508]EGO59620.1 hypothetical protein NEUTE1DRAFT_116581 [Neurospora tetrasperma FGSC 2508]EGZ73752.1 hypothetical protein NEUTE2DRAFT_144273 [Neurospora tetrasperma FGSC 2509]
MLIFTVTGRQQDGPNSLSQKSDAQTKVNSAWYKSNISTNVYPAAGASKRTVCNFMTVTLGYLYLH